MNMIMQPFSSTASTHPTLYNSRRTILELEDLSSAASRCRSSIISSVDAEHILHLASPASDRSSCRPFFHRCLSSPTSRLARLVQKKLTDSSFRKLYFARLCRHHRPLLVLNDYQCPCGCRFAMRQGSVVLVDEKQMNASPYTHDERVSVISNQLMCSRVPWLSLCDLRSLRERVRTRSFYTRPQSFDV